jgi:hypothetical protein
MKKLKLYLGAVIVIVIMIILQLNHKDTEAVDISGNSREVSLGEEFTGRVIEIIPNSSPKQQYRNILMECKDGTKVYFTVTLSDADKCSVGSEIKIKVISDTWFYRNDVDVDTI